MNGTERFEHVPNRMDVKNLTTRGQKCCQQTPFEFFVERWILETK
ncbi:hypothetical protein FHW16_004825 [Phyllobacterium myrsinacearum]|uniref:Uncharacterized protein n=1 Tax=Phyllobacterium myrsinacearum TaxID=28101 RepID=A0A839EX68_9HYPH|nr:hypothetical protein [Phyllobacterium myrsinacearum]